MGAVLTDATIWATYLIVVIGISALVAIAIAWLLTTDVTGRRLTHEAARRLTRRVVYVDAVVFVAAFLGGWIVGLLQ
jgi:hypothetical protein